MIRLSDILTLETGSTVTMCGIVHAVRELKKYVFLTVKQEGLAIQIVFEKPGAKVPKFSRFQHIEVQGVLQRSGKGNLEIFSTSVHVLGECKVSSLLDEGSSLEVQLDERHVSLRFDSSQSIIRLSSMFEYALRKYWFEKGYTEIHTPKILHGATESGSEVFTLDYFGTQASLAQSPQFYKQMAVIGGFDRVFEVGSVFRAEPSFTSKHSTDFTMIDVEIGGIASVQDVMEEEESMLRYALGFLASSVVTPPTVKEKIAQALGVPLFFRITHKEVVDILVSEFGHSIAYDQDLDSASEKMICDFSRENGYGEFVFVTHYPSKVRPFYTMLSGDDMRSESYDLLWSGLEITSGAQREHRLSFLIENLARKSIEKESVSGYLKFFEASAPPHGGFGLGLARVIAILCDQPSIRTCGILFRGPNRLTP